MSKRGALSGGQLAVIGLAFLALPELASRLGLGDLGMAAMLFLPTLVGMPLLAIGVYRMIRQRRR